MVDVMTGIPSIVAGTICLRVVFQSSSGLVFEWVLPVLSHSASLMIPVVVRSSEEMLRLYPANCAKRHSLLGVPKWLTILRVVIPTAIGGLVTGIMIAIARVIGEDRTASHCGGIYAEHELQPFQRANDDLAGLRL